MSRRLLHSGLAIALTVFPNSASAAASESPYVGAAACAPCHPAQVKKQSGTHHAKALQRAELNPLAQLLPQQPIRERNGTSFEYEAAADGIEVVASQDGKSVSGLLQWIFGAGALALTPVGRTSDGYFEHRVSWYTASSRPGMTLGHTPARPNGAADALGRRLKADEITRCFGCHAAGVRPGPDLDWMEPGVQCERCHGPGRLHVQTHLKSAISQPSAKSALEQVTFCAQCHRAPVETLGKTPEQKDPMLVRFAPVGLVVSRCFEESGTLTCLTCHDPHEDARKDPAYYSDKCQDCHEQKSSRTKCAFSKGDCLSCHMRKRTPVKDLTFTDHRIRIERAR